ncbi:cytochrome c peroxidase, mitochondrial [Cryptococcus deuterogattii MMRL2647]|nr:cytochrome c peroxidase, mitochondrial [Cryptococcus deuterogattii MMRL2647]
MTTRKSITGLPKLLRRRVTTMALWPPSFFAWLGIPRAPIIKRMELEARTMLP